MILTKVIKSLLSGSRKDPVDLEIGKIRDALAANDLITASAVTKSSLAKNPDHDGLLFCDGLVELRQCNHVGALTSFVKARAEDPDNPDYRFHVALCRQHLGDAEFAINECNAVLADHPNYSAALNLLACIASPGPYYTAVLAELHNSLKPATYLEIGVELGRTIALARSDTLTIGVDPAPQIAVALGPNVKIFRMTSDEFFANHNVHEELGNRMVDMAFIDGMHHFDFVLRDFAAIERYCSTDSIILIHDCYPYNRRTAMRERQSTFWSGDVWKAVLALKKYRPDLAIHTIETAPTGLGLIRNLDPNSRVLNERMDEIVEEFSAVDYSILDNNKQEILNRFPNHWPSIEKLARSPTSSMHHRQSSPTR